MTKKSAIVELVEKMLEMKKPTPQRGPGFNLELQIDALVYDLTEEEIKIVEGR